MRQHNIWCVRARSVWRGMLDCSNVVMWQHNIWCVRVHRVWRGTEHTQTHQMLCCRITTLNFYIFNKF